MYKLTYDNCETIRQWTGTYNAMLNKQDVLCNAYDYDCSCFTLERVAE